MTKNFRTILGAMMPAKVTIFSGGGPELCFIVLLLSLHRERAFEKREQRIKSEYETMVSMRSHARAKESKSIREREKETSHVRSVLTAALSGDPPRKKVQLQRTTHKREKCGIKCENVR